MSCSNKKRYARVGGHMKSHAALSCCWKRKMLLSTHATASKRKGCLSTINVVAMIEATRAQLPKEVVGAMVAIDMSPMPSKIIRKEACLHVKSPSGLSKDLELKKCPNT